MTARVIDFYEHPKTHLRMARIYNHKTRTESEREARKWMATVLPAYIWAEVMRLARGMMS